MEITHALWDLIAEWRDWASAPNIDPSERRDIALKKFLDCIDKEDSFLNLSHLSLNSLPTLPEWLTDLNISNIKLTTLSDNLPKALNHLDVGNNQLTSLPAHLPENLLELHANANELTELSNNLPKNY